MLCVDGSHNPQPLPFGLACQPDLARSQSRKVDSEFGYYPYLTVLKGVSDLGYQIPSFHPASSFEGQSPDGDALSPCHHKG